MSIDDAFFDGKIGIRVLIRNYLDIPFLAKAGNSLLLLNVMQQNLRLLINYWFEATHFRQLKSQNCTQKTSQTSKRLPSTSITDSFEKLIEITQISLMSNEMKIYQFICQLGLLGAGRSGPDCDSRTSSSGQFVVLAVLIWSRLQFKYGRSNSNRLRESDQVGRPGSIRSS